MVEVDAGLTAGAAIDGLDKAAAMTAVQDSLVRAVMALRVGEKGSGFDGPNADRRL